MDKLLPYLRSKFKHNFVFLTIVSLLIVFITYSYQDTYVTPYDAHYMKDLYDHSQWVIPLSVRSVGDELLYQVAGYELVKTGSLFLINPEVPPLGKYFYGTSILIFNNPHIISLFLFLATLIVFYFLSSHITKDKRLAKIAVLFLASDLLIVSQNSQTMLDLPQLFFLLIHMYALLIYISKEHKKYQYLFFIFLLGISLGAFIAIKIAFLAAIIVAGDMYILWRKKKLYSILPILLLACITYILTYLPYFLSGHTFVEFLKAQKWMLHFYLTSNAEPSFGIVIPSLLFGWTKGWTAHDNWRFVDEWFVTWPLFFGGFVLTTFALLRHKMKQNISLTYLIILTIGFIFSYCYLPFFVRYLTLVIPILILFFVLYFRSKLFFSYILIFLSFIHLFIVLSSFPIEKVNGTAHLWEIGAYQDLYGIFDSPTKKQISRADYWRFMQSVDQKLAVKNKSVHISTPSVTPWQTTAIGQIQIDYKTTLGKLHHTMPISFVKEFNSWKIKWNPNLAANNLTYKTKIYINYRDNTSGRILHFDGKVLSYGGIWPYIMVTPNKIKDEGKLQAALADLVEIKKFEMEWKYKANNQPDWPAGIGFIRYNYNLNDLPQLRAYPAMSLTWKKTRLYHEKIVTDNQLTIMQKWENYYKNKLTGSVGGEIILENPTGKKILLSKQPVDGQDVTLNKSQFQLK